MRFPLLYRIFTEGKTGRDATHSYKNLVGMGPDEEFLQELTKVGGEFTGTN